MQALPERPTNHGAFQADPSGVWHYTFRELGDILLAADDALANRPSEPCWFWFNGTPAPIHPRDSVRMLVHRWNEWRNAYQSGDPQAFLDKLFQNAGLKSGS